MSYTLLLADDSVTTHRVMELTFAEQGIRVVAVSDGETALERLRAARPDIVLVEAVLPQVDGYQIAEFMRGEPALADVPVLLLTGAFDTIDEQRVRACGAAGVIAKPCEPEVVIKRVKELLGLSAKMPQPIAPMSGRMVTLAEPPPQRPPSGPRGVGAPPVRPNEPPPRATVPPPREMHAPAQPAAWDKLREATGLSPDTAPVEGQSNATDDYFDRLDEAFDSLDAQLSGRSSNRGGRSAPPARGRAPEAHSAPTAPARPVTTPVKAEPAVFEVDGDWFDGYATSGQGAAAPISVPTPIPPAPPADPVAAVVAPPVSIAPPPPPTANTPAAAVAPPAPVAPLAPLAPVAPEAHVADAFEALLAAEQSGRPHERAPAVELSEDVVDRIASRVADRLTQGALKDTITQVVSVVAERLIREEIARIRANANARQQKT